MAGMSDEYPRNPQIVALRFEPVQLTRARERRHLTKTALAKMIDKTPSAIGQFESGQSNPDASTIASLALALDVPPSFFGRAPLVSSIGLDACHFRSLRSASQYARRQAVRTGELVHEVLRVLEDERVELPKEQLSHLKREVYSADDIERYAGWIRAQWGMGLGPIPDMIRLVEAKGVRVLPLSGVSEGVDAFSMWHDGQPFMMLALKKPASRIQFDVAHELGHLLVHEDVLPGDPECERIANRFAAAFLLPYASFQRECPKRWNLGLFRALKRRWHVSIQALVMRAHHMGRLTSSSQRRAFVQLNQLGMRKSEPDEWELRPPSVLRKALNLVAAEVPASELARRLALHERDLRSLLKDTAPIARHTD